MSFVGRDKAGAITAVFDIAQPGLCEEELPDDHKDIASYVVRIAPKLARSPVAQLQAALVKKGIITKQEVDAEVSAK